MLNDYVIAQIRTWVPLAVGAVLAYLASQWGIIIDDTVALEGMALFTAVAGGAYYTLANLLAKWVPAFGWLLGYPATAGYGE